MPSSGHSRGSFFTTEMDTLAVLLKPELLIKTLGLIGVFCVLFAESGLFFGFFLPGDSLLFTAGVLASQGLISYPLLLIVTFLRTFAPIVAGAAKMHYRTFILFNIIGGLLWAVGIASLGYFLGNIPIIKHNYEIVIFLIVIGSLFPLVLHFVLDKEKRDGMKHRIRSFMHRGKE